MRTKSIAFAVALSLASIMTGCGGNSGSTGSSNKELPRSAKLQASAGDYETVVEGLYVAYFGRPADPAGLSNFENTLLSVSAPTDVTGLNAAYQTNATVRALIDSFGKSSESQALYGSQSTTAFVQAVFQNGLNRQPAPSGLSFWVNAIDSGSLTPGDAALAIMAGALQNQTAQGQLDTTLVNNRLTVASYFSSQVASQNATSQYVGANAATSARTMLSGVTAYTNTGSYETTVNTAVANLGNAAKGVSFSPASVSLNYQAGTSLTTVVTVSATNASEFAGKANVYAAVSDPNSIFTADQNLVASGNNAYAITLHTSATVGLGQYQGNLSISLCSDSQCKSPLPGSPFSLPYNVHIAAAALVASPQQSTVVTAYSGTTTPSINVSVQGPTLVWSATSSVAWMQPSVSGGTGSGSFSINFLTSSLLAGNYSGNIVVNSKDGQTVTIPVSLTVLATSFQITSGAANFTAVNGAPIPAQPVSFSLSGNASDPWSASSSSSWLSVTPTTGVTPGTVNIGIDPTVGPLASGSYTGNVTVASQGATSLSIPVSLNLVQATLGTSSSTISFGGPAGRSFSPQALNMTLNTGSNSWPWTLTNLPGWLSASAQSGSLGASGTSISLTPNPAAASVGSTTAVASVNAKVNGDSLAVPVNLTLNVDTHKLLSSEIGIGLTAVPGWSRLTHTVNLTDNFGASTAWTAQSSQSWLTVTGSGTTGSGGSLLTLTANPSGLPVDAISYATVTVTPGSTSVQPVTIKVALWNGSTTPSGIVKLTQTYTKVIADTIRPLAYTNNGGTSIDIYNVYTQQKVGTMSGLGAALGDMAVSANGDRLYVLDTASRTMVVVDLTMQTLFESWPVTYATTQRTHLVSVHPNGKEIVLVGDGTAYTADGAVLAQTNLFGVLSASANGNMIYSQDEGYSPSGYAGDSLDYSDMSGGTLMHQYLGGGSTGSNGADIAVSPDGTRLYTADGAPYHCSQVDPKSMTLIGALPGGDAYPNNVEVGVDGRVYCGISGWYSTYDVWVYSTSGAILTSFKFAGYAQNLLQRQMVISSDGLMMTALTSDPRLVFVTVGP